MANDPRPSQHTAIRAMIEMGHPILALMLAIVYQSPLITLAAMNGPLFEQIASKIG